MDAGFAADGGAGVLFLYGNYTGDVMNFGMAEEWLAEEGITARSFVVTDDIASAPSDRVTERRGIADSALRFYDDAVLFFSPARPSLRGPGE